VLEDFIASNRSAIIERTRASVAARSSPGPSELEVQNGIPLFLDQLGEALRLAKSSNVVEHERISFSADLHGHELHRVGRTIGQVVHDYGDVCQAITELAVEQKAAISGEEFKTLNLCLDDAIAGAVTGYAHQREREIQGQGFEHLGILAHELRNLLNTALLSYDSIKSGRVAIGGSTGMILGRSLLGLRDLVDRSLAEVRMDVGIGRPERISVAEFVEEVEIGALIQAEMRGIQLTVGSVDAAVSIEGDRQILAAAVSNLLQNAFKFSRANGNVSLTVHTTDDRVRMDIEDECGGLSGEPEELFQPFVQRGTDRSGVGLGLSVCMKAAKASSGELHVRNLPGKGCIFTLDLPRKDTSASA
jgi:signal transduction histidine kinase